MRGGGALAGAGGAIDRLACSGLDTASFAAAVDAELQRVVPHAASCVVTVDPATLLLTGTYKFGDLAGRHERDAEWAALEYGTEDPTGMTVLARQGVPVAAVSHLPGGIEDSPRARTLLPSAGYGDELRMVARHDGHTWGGVNLFREADAPPFSDDEVAVVASVSGSVAAGLRSGTLTRLAACDPGTLGDGPAVLIVGTDGQIGHVSLGAEALLDQLTSGANRSPASSFVHALVAGARRFAAGQAATLPGVRARLATGRWLVAHAAPLAGRDGLSGDVVVTIEEARPPEIVPLLVAAFGLTAREREVTQLVLLGHDTKTIAGSLRVSSYTVQDHLKSIFDKADVRSRRELMARVFFDQYAPRLSGELGPTGWFLPDATERSHP